VGCLDDSGKLGPSPKVSHYELVAFDADGDETDRASASDADVCIG